MGATTFLTNREEAVWLVKLHWADLSVGNLGKVHSVLSGILLWDASDYFWKGLSVLGELILCWPIRGDFFKLYEDSVEKWLWSKLKGKKGAWWFKGL